MSKRQLLVQIKRSYGHDRIYPINEDAKLICELTGRKVLRREELNILYKLGYEVRETK